MFRFNLACRPQECHSLTWENILADFKSVWFSSSKTKKGRTVALSTSVTENLRSRFNRLQPSPDDLVFTSREGLPVNNANFRRLWRIVLTEIGIPYRKPYTTRKSGIRYSLLSGEHYLDVAAAAGHDPATMHKYYGDAIQNRSVLKSFE